MNKTFFSYGKYVHNNFGKTTKIQRINKIKLFLSQGYSENKSFYKIPYHQQYENRDFISKKPIHSKCLDNYQKNLQPG